MQDASQRGVDASGPGKRSLTEQLGGGAAPGARAEAHGDHAAGDGATSRSGAPQRIDRKEGGGQDTISGMGAQLSVENARGKSAGQPLDPATRGKMEGAFSADFGDVRVHQGAAAGEAASGLNARAFTADKDIFFGAGQYNPASRDGGHLLAHELTHVVQQRDAAKGTGNGATISSAGDATEHQADAAADAVMRGDSVGPIASAPSSVIHRDALGDIDSVSKGNWIGNVDEGEALSKLAALPPADKQKLANDSSYHGLLTRLCGAFNKGEMLRMFTAVPQFDLRWRIYWLGVAGVRDELSDKQWNQVIGFAGPAEIDALRAYPDGYNAFLANAPARLIAPWDLLEGLAKGKWKGSATDVRNAVEGLNPTQKATVLADNGKMIAIITHAGDSNEKFRTIAYLSPPLKWKVFWLKLANAVDHLTSAQWAEMLAQAPQLEYDELVGWKDMWQVVEKNCPASVIQITRKNAKTDNATEAMTDPVQVNAMFASLGPAGFLAETVKGADVKVAASYAMVQSQHKVLPTVNGLERGARMGSQSKAALRVWFFLETDASVLEQMVAVRFNVNTTGKGSMDHESGDDPATLAPWTTDSLRQCWVVMERLPPQQVEQNPSFRHLLRNSAKGQGEAYFWGKDVVMGVNGTGNVATDQVAGNNFVYQTGGQAPGSPQVAVNQFNATLRHEIGHSVDDQLGVMDQMKGQDNCGGWVQYGDYDSFVDAIIAAHGGLGGHGYTDEDMVEKAMRRAVEKKKSFLDAYGDVSGDGRPAFGYNKGPAAVVWTTNLWSGQPWYDNSWVTTPTKRNFQRAYGDESSLYSFRADIKDSRRVTAYQWRAPAEWFAEVYQVYYAEQETNPNVPVGGVLRSKDQAAAALMAGVVDRGYSPQDMRGGTTNKAPGT